MKLLRFESRIVAPDDAPEFCIAAHTLSAEHIQRLLGLVNVSEKHLRILYRPSCLHFSHKSVQVYGHSHPQNSPLWDLVLHSFGAVSATEIFVAPRYAVSRIIIFITSKKDILDTINNRLVHETVVTVLLLESHL
jgi:hypothetical protein